MDIRIEGITTSTVNIEVPDDFDITDKDAIRDWILMDEDAYFDLECNMDTPVVEELEITYIDTVTDLGEV